MKQNLFQTYQVCSSPMLRDNKLKLNIWTAINCYELLLEQPGWKWKENIFIQKVEY